MNTKERDLLAIRSWAGNSAMRITSDYGAELAPDLIAEAADTFIRALGAVTSPQEARDRLEFCLGQLHPRHRGKPQLTIVNSQWGQS
jgi:hypothetical protein